MFTRSSKRKRRRTPLFYGVTFRLILIVAASFLLLSYLSVYINPASFSVPLFFGLFFIPIVAINLFLLITALIRRSHSAWIPLIALLPALLFAEAFFKVGNKKGPENDEAKIKIESYNVGMFYSSKENADRHKILSLIEKHVAAEGADVVCLQEVFLDDKSLINKIFNEYKYRVSHLFPTKNGHCFGNLILSRHKIVSAGRIGFNRSTNLSIYADIIMHGDTVRLYNNHLESYNISFTNLVKKIEEARLRGSKEMKTDIKDVHSKMKNTVIRRSKQVDAIFGSIALSPYPTIICGDLNDTPMSYTYHKLSRKKKDTFRESGYGFAATYKSLWPLLRIDYIFVPTDYECISHNTLKKITLSDHYPIVAEFIQ